MREREKRPKEIEWEERDKNRNSFRRIFFWYPDSLFKEEKEKKKWNLDIRGLDSLVHNFLLLLLF